MKYTLVVNFAAAETAKEWFEDTFDLSTVLLTGIIQSAFRGQQIIRVIYNGEQSTPFVAAFESGLNKLVSVYPEANRVLSWWSKDDTRA